jgi:glycosyltransferase involved in cell wall biosynthesis
MAPIVSVITPCHNDGQYLRRNIESVRQSGRDYEHVIVDDGSTDRGTLDLLNDLSDQRIRVLHKSRSGPASARNHGIRHARGRYILNLDADDMATSAPFEHGVQILDQDADVDVVYGSYENFGAVHRTIQALEFCPFKMLFSNHVGIGSLYRRSSWEAVQGYAEAGMIFEDWHFWLKILAKGGSFRKVNATFFRYFVRPSGKSFSDDRQYRRGFNQIRDSLPDLYKPDSLRRLASLSDIGVYDRLYIQYALPLLKQGRRTPLGKRMAWFASAHLRHRANPASHG